MNLNFYTDPGHGWLAVKRNVLNDLGIERKITAYSYQRGETVYLEEDLDAATFIVAARNRGIEPVITHKFNAKRSPIRGYESYRVNTYTQAAASDR